VPPRAIVNSYGTYAGEPVRVSRHHNASRMRPVSAHFDSCLKRWRKQRLAGWADKDSNLQKTFAEGPTNDQVKDLGSTHFRPNSADISIKWSKNVYRFETCQTQPRTEAWPAGPIVVVLSP